MIDQAIDNLALAFVTPLKAYNCIVHNNLSKIRIVKIALVPEFHQVIEVSLEKVCTLEVVLPLELDNLVLCLVDFFR